MSLPMAARNSWACGARMPASMAMASSLRDCMLYSFRGYGASVHRVSPAEHCRVPAPAPLREPVDGSTLGRVADHPRKTAVDQLHKGQIVLDIGGALPAPAGAYFDHLDQGLDLGV